MKCSPTPKITLKTPQKNHILKQLPYQYPVFFNYSHCFLQHSIGETPPPKKTPMTWLRPGVRFSRPSFQAHQHMWQTAHLPKPRCSGHIEPVKHPHRCCINLKWFKWLVIKENIQFKERLEVGTKQFFSYLAMYHLHRSSYWSSYLSRCMSISLFNYFCRCLSISICWPIFLYVCLICKQYIYIYMWMKMN